MSVKVAAACACVISVSLVTAVANESEYGENVQKTAAEIAASQMGDIRGSIDYDQVPVFTRGKSTDSSRLGGDKGPGSTSGQERTKLKSVIQTGMGIDNTATGSIKNVEESKPVIQLWDRFDRYGNPVDRYGNRVD